LPDKVVPISIGVGLPGGGGRVKRVLEKNAAIPARKEYQLGTTRDDQSTFDLWIFEGEGATVAECQYLGTIQLTGLPRGTKGSVRIAVTFELGEEFLLAVRAQETTTAREVEVLFTTQGTPAEVRKRVESEAANAAAGVTPPQASKETSRPGLPPPEPPAGLKGLWGRITGK